MDGHTFVISVGETRNSKAVIKINSLLTRMSALCQKRTFSRVENIRSSPTRRLGRVTPSLELAHLQLI